MKTTTMTAVAPGESGNWREEVPVWVLLALDNELPKVWRKRYVRIQFDHELGLRRADVVLTYRDEFSICLLVTEDGVWV